MESKTYNLTYVPYVARRTYKELPDDINALEPDFIDNNSDLARAQEDLDGSAAAYAAAIDEVSQIV